ncbi:isoprenylcysteine alpha-carbonyl methylesterase ICME protein [Trifolium pratense]|uniref:Isoprenylcysteine alpha-carbonyl methylesterase ICME protein n=1 Tax=Trifolium pratense TaxID=57577 RepID=A0A2K3KYI5_TRIPR|nr:isoprenylcysteine alpha-carbonyl methylesterase ICME protein [Trifolium pratense]
MYQCPDIELFMVGYRWITKLLALGCYAMLLMPGFLQVAYCYFFSNKVKRSVVYGDQPRNRLDLYLPADVSKPKPVLVFVTGGAWIIGPYNSTSVSLLSLPISAVSVVPYCF